MPQKLKPIRRAAAAQPPRVRRETAGLNNTKWVAFRYVLHGRRCLEAAARRESVCVDCACEGRHYGPLEVDAHHIIPRSERPDLTFVASNIEFVCKSHHRHRNNLEDVIKFPHRHVVYGKPGVGKTTYVANHASAEAQIWDADEHTKYTFPWPQHEVERLQTMRTQFVARAKAGHNETWVIVRWPNTAYTIACQLGASILRIDRLELR